MHHLLRECGGHCPLRLWTHVSMLHLWPQTQEDDQRVLPHLQEDNQRHHQDVQEHVGSRYETCRTIKLNSRLSKPLLRLLKTDTAQVK